MTALLHRSFELSGPCGRAIRGDVRVQTGVEPRPLVIVCHGFKGFKDWGGFPYLCEQLARKGLAVVIFNYSHSGVGADLMSISDLERFRENTLSLEQEDLRCVLEAAFRGTLPLSELLDVSAVGLLGHSRGGAAVLAVGAGEPNVEAVAVLASISRMRIPDREVERQWREKGVWHVVNKRTGQELPLGVCLLDDMKENEHLIENAARKLDKPLLVIHGSEDQTVGLEEGEELARWAENSRLEVLEGADHTFGIKHPFQGTTVYFERVISLVSVFFQEAFGMANQRPAADC